MMTPSCGLLTCYRSAIVDNATIDHGYHCVSEFEGPNGTLVWQNVGNGLKAALMLEPDIMLRA